MAVFSDNQVLLAMEQAQLYEAFPGVATTDLEAVVRVLPTSRQVADGVSYTMATLISIEAAEVWLTSLAVRIPYRVYFAEPVALVVKALTARQQMLLHCIYLRHHDGYVRQRHLEALFALSGGALEAFTTPFTFSLIGEYVQEILVVLERHLTPVLVASYVHFIKQNPRYWQQTQGRVTSYWDVYYRIRRRGAPRFQHYVGARIWALEF